MAWDIPFIFGTDHLLDITRAVGDGTFTARLNNAAIATEPLTGRRMVRFQGQTDGLQRTVPSDTEFYVGFRFITGGFGADNPLVTFFNSSGAAIASLFLTSTGFLQVRRSTTAALGQMLSPLSPNTEYYIELHLVIDASTGAFEVQVNGASAFSGSSLNTLGASGGCELIRWSGLTGTTMYVSDIYITDSGFYGPGIVEFLPVTSTDSSEWTPSQGGADAHEMVDDVPDDDDGTYIETSQDSAGVGFDGHAAASGTIKAVAAFAVARRPASGSLLVELTLEDLVAEEETVESLTPGDTAYAGLTLTAAEEDIDGVSGAWTPSKVDDLFFVVASDSP